MRIKWVVVECNNGDLICIREEDHIRFKQGNEIKHTFIKDNWHDALVEFYDYYEYEKYIPVFSLCPK